MVKQPDIDNHKLMYHPERVTEWKETGDCFPIYVEIGPTDACNHSCVFCALDFLRHEGNFIDKQIMLDSLYGMAKEGVKSVMFAGEGEPLLHKDIGLFVQEAKKYGMDVSITCNGALFTEEKRIQCLPNLSWIRFSVDSGSPENYSQVHRTKSRDFDRVIENIGETVKFRNKNKLETVIGVQFLMVPQNMEEAEKLARIVKIIGADNLQIKPYSHHPQSLNDLVVNPEKYNELENQLRGFDSEDFKIKFRRATIERLEEDTTYSECYGASFFALVDAKGDVIPCNLFYGNKEFTYGNLYEQNFREIWKGEKRKEVLEKLRKRGVADCRKGCRLDAGNKYLHRIENPEPHDNFI